MRRMFALILSCLLLCCFTACDGSSSESLYVTDEESTEDTVEEEFDLDWGVELSVSNVDSKGLTLTIEQSDVEMHGDLWTGSPYWIELYHDGQWDSVEETPSEYERAWTAEAYSIPTNGKTEFDINWEWIYGELSDGHYRIGKTISVSYDAGNRESQALYAEFEIQ